MIKRKKKKAFGHDLHHIILPASSAEFSTGWEGFEGLKMMY